MAWKLTTAAWAALGASLAGATAVGVGVALRRRRAAQLMALIPWLSEPSDRYSPKIVLGRGPTFTDAQRLEAIGTTWMRLIDLGRRTYGDVFMGGPSLWDWMASAGKMLSNVLDVIGRQAPRESADDAKRRWDADPRDVVAQLDTRLRATVQALALAADHTGVPLTVDGETIDLGGMVEDWATDAALTYLASTVPGAGSMLALGQLLGGPGWNYGIASRQELGPKERQAEWLDARRLVFQRMLDLIAYAK